MQQAAPPGEALSATAPADRRGRVVRTVWCLVLQRKRQLRATNVFRSSAASNSNTEHWFNSVKHLHTTSVAVKSVSGHFPETQSLTDPRASNGGRENDKWLGGENQFTGASLQNKELRMWPRRIGNWNRFKGPTCSEWYSPTETQFSRSSNQPSLLPRFSLISPAQFNTSIAIRMSSGAFQTPRAWALNSNTRSVWMINHIFKPFPAKNRATPWDEGNTHNTWKFLLFHLSPCRVCYQWYWKSQPFRQSPVVQDW